MHRSPKQRLSASSPGFSLPETLVALLVVGLLGTSALQVLATGLRALGRSSSEQRLQLTAEAALQEALLGQAPASSPPEGADWRTRFRVETSDSPDGAPDLAPPRGWMWRKVALVPAGGASDGAAFASYVLVREP